MMYDLPAHIVFSYTIGCTKTSSQGKKWCTNIPCHLQREKSKCNTFSISVTKLS